MDDEIYEGKYLEYGDEDEAILVCPVCSRCRKFITHGNVVYMKNGFGEIDHIDFEDWKCRIHGAIQPDWYWKGDFI